MSTVAIKLVYCGEWRERIEWMETKEINKGKLIKVWQQKAFRKVEERDYCFRIVWEDTEAFYLIR